MPCKTKMSFEFYSRYCVPQVSQTKKHEMATFCCNLLNGIANMHWHDPHDMQPSHFREQTAGIWKSISWKRENICKAAILGVPWCFRCHGNNAYTYVRKLHCPPKHLAPPYKPKQYHQAVISTHFRPIVNLLKKILYISSWHNFLQVLQVGRPPT